MKETCEGCKHLKITNTRLLSFAYCGNEKDELIVPHEFDGEKIRLIRIPNFCSGKVVNDHS